MAERKTRQQEIIAEILEKAEAPLTPVEIHTKAQKKIPNLGIATVYRGIKKLIEAKQAILVDLPGTAPRYESTSRKHHHHFVCRGCDQVLDIQGCVPGVHRIAPKHFIVESHEITLYGLCEHCAKN